MKRRSLPRTISIAAAWVTSISMALGANAQQATARIPFAQLGAGLLERAGVDTSLAPDQVRQSLLDKHFVRVPLGLFDARYPAAHLRRRRHAASFAATAEAVIRTQERWLHWASGTVDKSVKADIATLLKCTKERVRQVIDKMGKGLDRERIRVKRGNVLIRRWEEYSTTTGARLQLAAARICAENGTLLEWRLPTDRFVRPYVIDPIYRIRKAIFM